MNFFLLLYGFDKNKICLRYRLPHTFKCSTTSSSLGRANESMVEEIFKNFFESSSIRRMARSDISVPDGGSVKFGWILAKCAFRSTL
jgi:hypothetical protein